ncbi:lantibiotic dehydratase [Mucilaginibacter sp. 21P]|uniref:lantibiotic dehydratase n=1 Tax=Mucilaginibacter sp. 21P TaxID=2778902 RepID=UPI001C57F078|nr:lantibiotic dehydratase [Mucilaginibacter sp. 21P]QXV66791.1 lantibiotic dehydratase [Mucilaginibacter sp. 21P]
MDHFSFYKNLLLRSPVGSAARYTLDVEKILADEVFTDAVSIASPSFYKRIIQEKKLDPRTILTLRKYYNRFCFRPTPFGFFAGVALTSWAQHRSPEADRQLSIYVTADRHLDHLLRERSLPCPDDLMEPNPTLYSVQREFRFIQTETDPITGKRQYLLQATDRTSLLARLIRFCKEGRSRKELIGLIQRDSGCELGEAEDYLSFLTTNQILLGKQRSGITVVTDGVDKFPDFTGTYDWCSGKVHDLYQAASNSLNGSIRYDRPLLNVISFWESPSCHIDLKVQHSLSDGLWAMEQLATPYQVPALKRFADQFQAHFEDREIPILEILDPETGIAYGVLEKETGNNLLETFDIDRRVEHNTSNEWTAVHRFLLNAWHDQAGRDHDVIQLDEKALKQIKRSSEINGTSGFGVLFKESYDQVWIDSAGGYHTNALIGRFTTANEAIRNAAREMALQEQHLNPDIIFAEILHLTDLRTDNVNRRAQILDMEIPITAAASVGREMQIALNDLMVSVQDGQVLLRSLSRGSMVLPRQSSAYNHGINDLPLFRFLADLPYQYAAPLRTLDMIQLFPGLDRYPRVSYKQTVLSPAKWVLNADEIGQIKSDPHYFTIIKAKMNLPDHFLLTEGDQQLLFNSLSDAEVSMFIECIGKASQAILQEVPLNRRTGMPVCEQFNAFVLPVNPLKLPDLPLNSDPDRSNKRKFIPGSEWLYVKIYTSRLGTDALLRELWPFLKRQLRQGYATKWFFVRYEDRGPHLRLRLLIDRAKLGQIMVELCDLFERKVERNVIREFQVDTYSRELERYGVHDFEVVEDHFYASSRLVLRYLTMPQARASNDRILFALMVTHNLSRSAFPDEDSLMSFYQQRYQQLASEFSGDKLHVALDKKYREIKTRISEVMENKAFFASIRVNKWFIFCLSTYLKLLKQVDQKGPQHLLLVSSLIHMHLNRLFITKSRQQEMAVFYFLAKHMAGTRAKRAAGTGKYGHA